MPPRKKAPDFPPIPEGVDAPAGRVRIVLAETLEGDADTDTLGLWELRTRTISILAKNDPGLRWRTLFHELAHVALDDSGVANMLTEQEKEAVCDAISTQRMRERFG